MSLSFLFPNSCQIAYVTNLNLSIRRNLACLSIGIYKSWLLLPILKIVKQHSSITSLLYHHICCPLQNWIASKLQPPFTFHIPILFTSAMSRFFSSSARAFIKYIGFSKEKLPTVFKEGLDEAVKPGGKAEQVSWPLSQTNSSRVHDFSNENWLDNSA